MKKLATCVIPVGASIGTPVFAADMAVTGMRLGRLRPGWSIAVIRRNKPLWTFVCALVIAMAYCVQPAAAQMSIGSAAVIKNDVHGVRGSAARALATGGSVFSDDQVKTGDDSLAQLVFLDQTNLTVAANSQAVLREVYRPKQGYKQLVLRTVTGSFRYVSGLQSGHHDEVQFPQGYLTVRGTTVDLLVTRAYTVIFLVEGAITVVPYATRIPHDLSIPGTSFIVYNDGHVDGPMTREAAIIKLHLKVATEFGPPTEQVAYGWTGWYVGGNAGYSRGKVNSDFNDPGFPGLSLGNSPSPPGSFPTSLKPNGFIGGGQIGYNWQLDKSVFSLEADFQGSAERNGISFDNFYSCESVGFLGCHLAQTRDAKILWFGTARGRIGWLFTPTLLFYGTGGLAYGKVSAGGTISDPENTGSSFSFADSKVTVGYAAGAGIEGTILDSGSWSWRIEYLYLNLGSLSVSGTDPITGSAFNSGAKFTDNIVRVGLNYRFH
jgi:outer membrane immunogenic protein